MSLYKKSMFFVLAACLLLSRLSSAADLSAAIVRTEIPIVIDGNVKDWGGITATQDVLFADKKLVATFKMAYDTKNLYFLVNVVDVSPLRNSSTIQEELIKGDAVSLCLGTVDGKGSNQRIIFAQIDGKPVIMVYRPQSTVKSPYTFASPVKSTKMDYVGPLDGANAALKVTKGGYVVEAVLPWASLGFTPVALSTIPLDVQVIFGDPAGMTNIASAWWHTAGGDAFTVEDLPTEAALHPESWGSAKLYDTDPGQSLVTQQEKKTDGIPIIFNIPKAAKVSLVVTDEKGWILRELLRADKMDAGKHTIIWNGRDRYDEVLPPGQYKWKLIYFDGMGTKFVGSVGNSASPPYRTDDGKGSMGGQHGGASVIGADATGIYILGGTEEGHPAMRKVDSEGRTIWKRSMGGFGSGRAVASDGKYCYILNAVKTDIAIVRMDPDTGKDVPIVGKTARISLGDPKLLQVGGMAITGNKAFFSVTAEDRLGVVDLLTGKIIENIPVNKPLGLCALDEQNLLVCSEKSIVKINIADGKIVAFINDLNAPRAVVRDKQGQTLVSDLGESQQIKKFSMDGKLLAVYGKAGGRPATAAKYDPLEFRNIVGLAISADDQIWAVEVSTLRRVAKLTTEGKWLKDFYGPVAYNVCGPDLDDLSTVYYQASQNTPDYAKTKIDFAAYALNPELPMNAWKIDSVFHMTQPSVDGAEQDLMTGAMQPGYGHVVVFTAKNGTCYLWRIAKSNRATLASGAAIWRKDKESWIPACFVSNDSKKSKSWSDSNGDGLAQATEMYDAPPVTRFAWLTKEMVLYGWSGTLSPSRFDERGVPYYSDGVYTPYLRPGQPVIEDGHVFNSMPDKDGAVYFAANYGTNRHLSFWDRACENQIIKVQNGEIKWIIGQHDAQPKREGDLTTVSGIAGIVDDIVITHMVEPAQYIAYTTDGMTLGNVIVDENGKQPKVGPTAVYIESFTGLFVKDPKTQKRLLFGVRSGDDFIFEVTGPGEINRQDGVVILDSSRPREVITTGQTTIPYETWWGNVGRGYGIDGYDWEWLPKSAGIPIYSGKKVIGDVRLRRDAGALYVLADVNSDNLLHAGKSTSVNELFGKSEGIEIIAGSALVKGQQNLNYTRIYITLNNKGLPVALAYRNGDANAGWTIMKDVKSAIIPRWHGYGWRVEVEIPLTVLPDLSYKTKQTFKRGSGDMKTFTEERLDLTGDISFNTAFYLADKDGKIQRYPWIDNLLTTTDFNVTGWGNAYAPQELNIGHPVSIK
jgi:hypothetical protein